MGAESGNKRFIHDLPKQVMERGQDHIASGYENKSDLEVWREFKNEDKMAFIFIYRKYLSILYNYGHQFTCDEELIKDCIHDVFVQLNESKKRLSDVSNIKFYLLKCFKTRYLSYLKTNKWLLVGENKLKKYDFEFTISIEQKIINSQIEQEKLFTLNKAVQQLTCRQKEVIYYLFYEELSIDAIKDLMKVSNRRSIQNIVYRALAALKNALIFLIVITLFCLSG